MRQRGHTGAPPRFLFQFFPSCLHLLRDLEAEERRSEAFNSFPVASTRTGMLAPLKFDKSFQFFPSCLQDSQHVRLPRVPCQHFQFFPSCLTGETLQESTEGAEYLSILPQLPPTSARSAACAGTGTTFNSFPVASQPRHPPHPALPVATLSILSQLPPEDHRHYAVLCASLHFQFFPSCLPGSGG